MKFTELVSKKLFKEYLIKVPYIEVDKSIDKKIEVITPTISLPGFRKGKAPINIVKKKYESRVVAEVIEKIVQDNTKKLLEEKKIKPFRLPRVEITKYKKDEPVEINIKIDIQPELKISSFEKMKTIDYQINIDKKSYEENYENYIKSQKKYSKLQENRPIIKGDKVIINIKSEDDSLPDFLRSQNNMQVITDSNIQILPDIDKQLISKQAKVGDKLNIKFDLKEILKKDKKNIVEFMIEVTAVEKQEPLIINKEFLNKNNLKSESEFKNKINESLSNHYNNHLKEIKKKQLMDLLNANHQFDIPENIYDEEFKIIWQRVEKAKQDNKLDEDDKKLTDKKLKKRYEKIALRRVKLAVLMQKIAQENSISVNEKELTEGMLNYASQYPGQEKQIFDYFKKNPSQIESIKGPIFENKILDHILSKTLKENKEISIKEFKKLQDDTFSFKEDFE